jgi:hypothetical protein
MSERKREYIHFHYSRSSKTRESYNDGKDKSCFNQLSGSINSTLPITDENINGSTYCPFVCTRSV